MLRMQKEVINLRKELEDTEKEVKRRVELDNAEIEGSMTLDMYMEAKDRDATQSSLDRRPDDPSRDIDRVTSSKARPRSRLIEMHEEKDKFDSAVDQSKVNKSLFRVVRKTTKLKDPKKNSFVLGYWPDDDDADEKTSSNH